MASGVPILSLWTDLAAASGTRVGYLRLWSNGNTTLREDGDDRFTFTLDRTDGLVASVLVGYVVRAEYLDAETEEWIIERITDRWPADVLDVECAGARVWLAERVVLYDDSTATGTASVTYTGSPAEILTTLQALDVWPTWVNTGTMALTDDVTITLSSGNGLQALVAIRDALNAVRPVGDDPAVLRFRRVSATEWQVDYLTTATAGAYITTGKNLVGMSVQKDRTAQATAVAVTGAAGIMAAEALFRIRYQQAPSGGMIELGIEAIDGAATIVLEDNQYNGQYLVDSAGTVMEILDTQYAAIVSKVWVADSHTVVAPCVCRFARNSSGDPLLVWPWASAPAPARLTWLADADKARKINWVFIPWFDQYDAGALRGWTNTTTIGSGVFSQDTTDFETGTMGLKFAYTGTATTTGTTLGGVGGEFDGSFRPQTWVLGVRGYSTTTATASRTLTITSVTANGVGQSLSGTTTATWTGTTSGWQTAEVEFTMTGTTDTTIAVTFTSFIQDTGASHTKTVTIDRAWMFRKSIDDGDNTLRGSQMTDLISNAQRQLRATGGDPVTSYVVQVADLYRDNPSGYPLDALAPYTTVRLVVPERSVNETLRVVSVARQLDAPLSATLQLGAVRGRLTTII